MSLHMSGAWSRGEEVFAGRLGIKCRKGVWALHHTHEAREVVLSQRSPEFGFNEILFGEGTLTAGS